MVLLRNITLINEHLVTMDCHVVDQIENQDFSLEFDPVTLDILPRLKSWDSLD